MLAFMCLTTLFFSGCKVTMPKLSKSSKADIEKEKTDKHSVIIDESVTENPVEKHDTTSINANKPENRLSVVLEKEHSTIKPKIGVEKVVGDEELKVLQKVRRLEAKLRKEKDEKKDFITVFQDNGFKITGNYPIFSDVFRLLLFKKA